MKKYSVMFVDDEELVYDVMIKKMNWEEMGFEVKGYAHNGVEALEMAEEINPDVVMTDIKMPYMDGLTMTRKLKKIFPDIRVIILSGFDEFEFAKEAIRLEAEEYLLKPIDAEELRKVFARVKESLDKELDERRNIDKLEQYYLNSLPQLQNNFYMTLLDGSIEQGLIDKYASDYQIQLKGPFYVVSVLHISYLEKMGEEMEVAPFMLSIFVQKMLEEQLEDKWNSKILSYLGDVVVVSQLEDSNMINYYTDYMDRMCKMAERVCKAIVTVGIGYVVENPVDIANAYQEAKNAVAHRAILGRGRAINILEVAQKKNEGKNRVEGKASANIIKAIRLGEYEDIVNAAEGFCTEISKDGTSLQMYRICLMKLATELMELLDQYSIQMGEMSSEFDGLISDLYKEDCIDDIKERLIQSCKQIADSISEKRQDSRLSFVTAAEEYVKENYDDPDLGIESICEHLNVSSSYFSTAFKKATGKTFINYLTDYRMDCAVKMLDTSEYKSYEIADKVGYSDPNYFSYAFKKKYGVSPSKYRKQEN